MNVLSLFDGMSCGREALERCGFWVDNYYASEIDKYAMQIAKKNYPDTQHIGDVTKVKGSDLPQIDIVIGGSPCQGFSFAGKQLNFEDPRSKLFFEFVRLLEECKPKYFFLENVKMKKEHQDVISKYLGVEPIELNSALVSAQNRKRLYWTNIKGYTAPEDKGILLKDIVHERTDLALSEKELSYMLNSSGAWSPSNNNRLETYLNYPDKKMHCLTANFHKGVPYNVFLEELKSYIVPFEKTLQILDKEVERGKVGYFRKDSQANRVYYIHDKAVTLCGDAGGGGAAKTGQYLFGEPSVIAARDLSRGDKIDGGQMFNGTEKAYTLTTSCINQGLLFGCITSDRVDKRQNGQRFNEGTKFYTLTAQDKHGILIEGYIRKLTPIECERLQTLPDNYTAGVSNSQRYKMLGNGWTVDAICEFFKHIPKDLELL
jgi:DNA-cytosine methyltransferase